MSLLVDIEKKLGGFTLKTSFRSEGNVLGLLGPSGCGKSITLRCIAGVMRPDKGRIVLNGVTLFDSEQRIDLPPQKRKVGFLFQNYALFPNMTVEKNILCGLYGEKDKAVRQKKLKDVLRLLQLEGLTGHRPSQLSGGQAQRVALARILVGQPELLLLDEPFSALDSHLREKLQVEMRSILREFGKDAILVTHSREEAFHLCHQLAVMERGSVLVQKETRNLFDDPQKVQAAVLTGCKNIVPARKRNAHLVEIPNWGIQLETAQKVPDSLTHIGIRGHSFDPAEERNSYPVTILDAIEEPFEWVVRFRFEGQSAGSPEVWWRVAKTERQLCPEKLGTAPQRVLLLES